MSAGGSLAMVATPPRLLGRALSMHELRWLPAGNFHVKIDGCVGQSFIRPYATLARVTNQSDVVLSYVGTTKAV
jgi:NADPH-dependent glutamate synthase beta subunit-like oxidoreductase